MIVSTLVNLIYDHSYCSLFFDYGVKDKHWVDAFPSSYQPVGFWFQFVFPSCSGYEVYQNNVSHVQYPSYLLDTPSGTNENMQPTYPWAVGDLECWLQ